MRDKLINVFQIINSLPEKEQDTLIDHVMSLLGNTTNNYLYKSKSMSCNEMIQNTFKGKPDCPYCKAEAKIGFIQKYGFRNGVQCYKCKHCGKTFVSTTNTVFARTRKNAEIWRKFIKLTLMGATLEICVSECNISMYTAFVWRHKLFNVFSVNQNDTFVKGIIEIDETYFRISYKGNHLKGKYGKRSINDETLKNDMPRPAHKRGVRNGANPDNSVCTFCIVERSKKVYFGKVLTPGRLNSDDIATIFNKHVNPKNLFVYADKSTANKKYLQGNNIPHELLSSNISKSTNKHLPEIKGDIHTQTVNSLHSDIKFYLHRYRGVSTKYLHNYISFCIWMLSMHRSSKRYKKLTENTITRASYSDCYISAKELMSFPSIPISA